MDNAILDLIETELIFVKEERSRLKDKKTNLERIRAALKSGGAASGTTIITNVKKEGKRKAGKDPNKPKRPQSAYNLFYQEKASLYKQSNPELPQKDIMSLIGPKWKECPADEKAVFEEKAKELKAEFDIKLAAYHAGKTEAANAVAAIPEVTYQQEEEDDDDSDDDTAAKKKMKREK